MLSSCKIRIIIILVVLFTGLGSHTALADDASKYSGAYSNDLVWSGVVTMVSDVLVQKGASLTIRAGTQVNIVPAEGTKIDPEYLSSQTELLVRGRLDVQGTAEQPVRFVVMPGGDNEDFAWAGVTLDEAEESRIAFAVIDRAEIAIRCVNSSPEIIGNLISSSRYGIVLQQRSHPKVLNNVLKDGEGGVFCWRGSNPYLLNNQIIGHDEEALFVDAESRPWLDRNRITDNEIGLALYARDLPYDLNEITGNREDVRWLGHQGQGGKQ